MIEILGHIYYAIGLIVILSILTLIVKFKSLSLISEWAEKFKLVTGKSPEDKDYKSKEEKDLIKGAAVLVTLEFIWAMGGLLTYSWYIFLSMLLYSIIIGQIFKPIKYSILGKIVTLFSLFLRFSVYLFLIINHFHLHYDLFSIIKNFIK